MANKKEKVWLAKKKIQIIAFLIWHICIFISKNKLLRLLLNLAFIYDK